MIDASHFSVGDPVENSYGARGTVSEIVAGTVTVTYSDRRGSWTVKHTDRWFSAYPEMLKKIKRGGSR